MQNISEELNIDFAALFDNDWQPLWEAVNLLSSVCDGAHDEDGVGFNGSDTKFGKRSAMIPVDDWTPAMAREVWEMLRKYSGQLLNFGIEYAALPEPKPSETSSSGREVARSLARKIEDREARSVDFADSQFVIKFNYEPTLVSDVRTIPGATWDAGRKQWTAPAVSAGNVRGFALDHDFNLSDTAASILSGTEAIAVAPVVPETGSLKMPNERELVFSFPYNPEHVQLVKTIAGRRWDSKTRTWRVPITAANEALGVAEIIGLDVDSDLAAMINEKKVEQDENLAASTATDADINIEGLGGELMPYQRAGVAYAMKARRTFIADEMGLGKTIQAIASLKQTDAFPALIVAPATLKENWRREFMKWIPGITVSIAEGSQPIAKADVVIINYDIMVRQLENLKKLNFKGLVLDESHKVKNPKAKWTIACKQVAQAIPEEGVVLLLTGTPVLNRPMELVSQLEVMGRIKDFGGVWAFKQRYCGATRNNFGWDFSGSSNRQELNSNLRRICYVRRKKEDVLKELPPKSKFQVPSVLTPEYQARYNAIEADTLAYLAENGYHAADQAEHLRRISLLRRAAGEGKVEAAFEWIDSFLEETERKLVVFGFHKTVVKAIAERYDGLRVMGEDSKAKRQEAIDAFQTDPTKRVIALNLQAGGVGITLTAASDVLFVEQGWTPAEHDQAEDRCHRIGQNDNVTAWYLVASETIDEDTYGLIQSKRVVVDAVTDGESNQQEQKSILSALMKKMAERTMV